MGNIVFFFFAVLLATVLALKINLINKNRVPKHFDKQELRTETF